MLLEQFRENFDSLSAEAQKKESDYVATIISRYKKVTIETPEKMIPLSEEPFIGVWADRLDMEDSSERVRDMREQEWNR